MIFTLGFINRRFHGFVDFDTFYLLAAIPRKGKNAILLLAPGASSRIAILPLRGMAARR